MIDPFSDVMAELLPQILSPDVPSQDTVQGCAIRLLKCVFAAVREEGSLMHAEFQALLAAMGNKKDPIFKDMGMGEAMMVRQAAVMLRSAIGGTNVQETEDAGNAPNP